jgi:hypothetical protein
LNTWISARTTTYGFSSRLCKTEIEEFTKEEKKIIKRMFDNMVVKHYKYDVEMGNMYNVGIIIEELISDIEVRDLLFKYDVIIQNTPDNDILTDVGKSSFLKLCEKCLKSRKMQEFQINYNSFMFLHFLYD